MRGIHDENSFNQNFGISGNSGWNSADASRKLVVSVAVDGSEKQAGCFGIC